MDWNLVLNIAALLALSLGVLRIGSDRRRRENITDLEKVVLSKEKRVDQLEDDMKGCTERAALAETRAIEAEKAVAKWEARYEEISRYTAQSAVEHFEGMMADHSAKVAERHQLMLQHLAHLESALTESSRSLAELVLKAIELTARVAQRVDVTVD